MDQFAASGAVGSALWLVGGGYVALGLVGRRSLPVLTEGLGAATAIVGAAITVSSTPGFGLPLLVNVPWFIGRFFPGEGRVPL